MVRAVVVILVLLVASAAQAEGRFALLIGNQAYDRSVGVLKNPYNDIGVVGDALARQGFQVLPPIKDATRVAILGGVRDLVRRLNAAGSGAIGFIYYSGHGAAEKDTNINYLIPVDAKEPGSSAFWDESLKLDDILRLLDGARSAAKFIVFDACRSELQLPTKDTTKGLVPVAEQQGMFIAYASAPGRTASDRGDGSGPYAAALATEFAHPGLDHLNLFQNVKENVLAATGGAQQPWESNGLGRRVYLTGPPKKDESRPQLDTPDQLSDASREWSRVDKTSIAELETFLSRHGSSVEADYARARLAPLKKQQADIVAQAAEAAKNKAEAERQRLAMLQEQEATAKKRAEGRDGSTAGRILRDCPQCPEMVVVPEGCYIMGSHENNDEKPVHQVTIAKPFAVSKFAVTFADWDACVAAGGCKHKPEDQGWGRKTRPVINVSWNDATKEYLPWLSRKTGKTYRLLTEAEWEYAARAGTTTAYAWGDEVGRANANCIGCDRQWGMSWHTEPVGSFRPNAFGLYDMHGNVWQWVEDCYHDTYQGAPTDGAAWVTCTDAGRRVARGGSWHDNAQLLRSAARSGWEADNRIYLMGFRLARSL
jgi:formylglycine-generating enzyme required for sulfatase activity